MKVEELISLIPEFKELQESPLILDDREVAYQQSVILEDETCLGTGFSLNRSMARQIALSEAIERRVVSNLYKSKEADSYLLNEYPSTCGFAVGFNQEGAKERAQAEAVERWLRSKWIDDGYGLDEFKVAAGTLTRVEAWFAEKFLEVRYFAHNCQLEGDSTKSVHSLVVVGLTEQGAFAGSKSVMNAKVPLLSALVEAWRHLEISESELETNESKVIRHYAKNRKSALSQIQKAVKYNMPSPKLRLLKEVPIPLAGVCGFRALCHDFSGWHGANLERFVY